MASPPPSAMLPWPMNVPADGDGEQPLDHCEVGERHNHCCGQVWAEGGRVGGFVDGAVQRWSEVSVAVTVTLTLSETRYVTRVWLRLTVHLSAHRGMMRYSSVLQQLGFGCSHSASRR